MIIVALLAVLVLLAIIIILGASLAISKAVNGVFLGLFGNLFWVVKAFCIVKKIVIIGIIIRLFSMEKKLRKDKTKTEKVEVEAE